MGTSRSYEAPTASGWPPLKRLVTGFGGEGGDELAPLPPFPDPVPPPSEPSSPAIASPQRLLSAYIAVNGGSARMAGRGGNAGGGGAGGGQPRGRVGRPIARAGQSLGGFATRVAEVGLATALREYDLGDLVGRSAQEVTVGLVERLAGPGSTMDENLARVALNKLRQELLAAAKTFEDVEGILRGTVQQVQVEGLLLQYYGHYLYERFARDFYERLVKSVGVEKARKSVESVRRTIFASLRAKVAGRDATNVNWRGAEGRELAERILVETLSIFEAGS